MKKLALLLLVTNVLNAAECPTPRIVTPVDHCTIGDKECPWNPNIFEIVGKMEQLCKARFGEEACFYGFKVKDMSQPPEIVCGKPLKTVNK